MQTIEIIDNTVKNSSAVMLYFSAPTCGVCKVLKPKLFEALEKNFPVFKVESIDISVSEDIAPYFGVFTIPTVIVFLDGKEFIRKSRNMSVDGLMEEIRRPYEIMLS